MEQAKAFEPVGREARQVDPATVPTFAQWFEKFYPAQAEKESTNHE